MRVWDYHEEQEYEIARRMFWTRQAHLKVAKIGFLVLLGVVIAITVHAGL
jgi:hypothetical protein